MKLNVLAIVAHPADSFDMIGGTLASHVQDGDNVTLAIMDSTDILNLFSLSDEMKKGKVSEEKIAEAVQDHVQSARDACHILGLEDVRFLKYKGEWLSHSPELVGKIADLIQEVRPHLIITHNPLEDGGASEHAAVGRMVVEAGYVSEGARNNNLPPHHVGQIYFMCWPGVTTWLDATTAKRYGAIMIDVTEYIEQKVRAYAHLSAHYITMKHAAKLMEGICGGPGIHTRVPYVETFQPYKPEVYKKLPISAHNLWLSESGWKEGLENLKLIAPYLEGVQEGSDEG
ncbi:MAG: PIG-L family deacetylase [Candidatus Latescibacterota bacterium]